MANQFKRDPLVVVHEFDQLLESGKKTEADLPEIDEDLDVLRARIDKVRRLFPEYKNLSFGDRVNEFWALQDKRRVNKKLLTQLRKVK
jgi:hypothetical protein